MHANRIRASESKLLHASLWAKESNLSGRKLVQSTGRVVTFVALLHRPPSKQSEASKKEVDDTRTKRPTNGITFALSVACPMLKKEANINEHLSLFLSHTLTQTASKRSASNLPSSNQRSSLRFSESSVSSQFELHSQQVELCVCDKNRNSVALVRLLAVARWDWIRNWTRYCYATCCLHWWNRANVYWELKWPARSNIQHTTVFGRIRHGLRPLAPAIG